MKNNTPKHISFNARKKTKTAVLCLLGVMLFALCSCGGGNSKKASDADAKAILAALEPEYNALLNYFMRDGFILPGYAMEADDFEAMLQENNCPVIDGTAYFPVQNESPKTIAELKELTEKTVTEDFAARQFYITIPQNIREIDGRIHLSMFDFPGTIPVLPKENISVTESSGTLIRYTATDENYGFLGEDTSCVVTLLKNEKTGSWRLDSITVSYTGQDKKQDKIDF